MKGWGIKGMKGAAKGKSKGPTGPQLERERLTADKFSGTVSAMKGKFGFIEPAEAIDHPNAQKKNGALWFSVTDILSGREALEVGEEVSFHIYNDSSGVLGCEEIEDFGAPAGVTKPAMRPTSPASYGKAAGKVGKAASPYAAGGKAAAWGKGTWGGKDAWGFEGYGGMDAFEGAWGKGGFGGFDGGKGKGKGKDKGKSTGPSGPSLERERLTAEKFSGELVDWKGKFGYIQPAEPIEHEAAKRKGGKVWVSISDCPGGVEMAVGTVCAFHVYLDSTGVLGAEEVE